MISDSLKGNADEKKVYFVVVGGVFRVSSDFSPFDDAEHSDIVREIEFQ